MSNVVLLVLLTLLVVVIGGFAWMFKKGIALIQQPLTIVSSAMVCGIIFMHIFPELFVHGGVGIGIALLSGVFLQLIIERLTGGFEHGHGHIHGSGKGMIIGLMAGLCIHAFVEGTPLLILGNEQSAEVLSENVHVHHHDHSDHHHAEETSHQHDGHDHSNCSGHSADEHKHVQKENSEEKTGTPFAISDDLRYTVFAAIMSHNIPITIMMITLFLNLGYSFKRSFTFLAIFALAAPLGAVFGLSLLKIEGFASISMYLIAISTGMLLHIITHILTEQGHGHKSVSLPIQISSLIMGLVLVVLLFGW
jgi:zinc transporter ZupT